MGIPSDKVLRRLGIVAYRGSFPSYDLGGNTTLILDSSDAGGSTTDDQTGGRLAQEAERTGEGSGTDSEQEDYVIQDGSQPPKDANTQDSGEYDSPLVPKGSDPPSVFRPDSEIFDPIPIDEDFNDELKVSENWIQNARVRPLDDLGILNKRPEIISSYEFEPLYPGDDFELTAAGRFFDIQTAARNLKFENISRLLAVLKSDENTSELIDDIVEKFDEELDLADSEIALLEEFRRKLENASLAFNVKTSAPRIQFLASAEQGYDVPSMLDVFTQKLGFDVRENDDEQLVGYDAFSSTKVVAQLIVDLHRAVTDISPGLLDNQSRIQARRTDKNPFRINRSFASVGADLFDGNATLRRSSNLRRTQFNELMNALPSSRDYRIKIILSTLSKEFRVSSRLGDGKITDIINNYGISSDARFTGEGVVSDPFDNILGVPGDLITDKSKNSKSTVDDEFTSLSSLLRLGINSRQRVLPHEPKFIKKPGESATWIPGKSYLVDSITSTEPFLDTAPIQDYAADADRIVQDTTEALKKLLWLDDENRSLFPENIMIEFLAVMKKTLEKIANEDVFNYNSAFSLALFGFAETSHILLNDEGAASLEGAPGILGDPEGSSDYKYFLFLMFLNYAFRQEFGEAKQLVGDTDKPINDAGIIFAEKLKTENSLIAWMFRCGVLPRYLSTLLGFEIGTEYAPGFDADALGDQLDNENVERFSFAATDAGELIYVFQNIEFLRKIFAYYISHTLDSLPVFSTGPSATSSNTVVYSILPPAVQEQTPNRRIDVIEGDPPPPPPEEPDPPVDLSNDEMLREAFNNLFNSGNAAYLSDINAPWDPSAVLFNDILGFIDKLHREADPRKYLETTFNNSSGTREEAACMTRFRLMTPTTIVMLVIDLFIAFIREHVPVRFVNLNQKVAMEVDSARVGFLINSIDQIVDTLQQSLPESDSGTSFSRISQIIETSVVGLTKQLPSVTTDQLDEVGLATTPDPKYSTSTSGGAGSLSGGNQNRITLPSPLGTVQLAEYELRKTVDYEILESLQSIFLRVLDDELFIRDAISLLYGSYRNIVLRANDLVRFVELNRSALSGILDRADGPEKLAALTNEQVVLMKNSMADTRRSREIAISKQLPAPFLDDSRISQAAKHAIMSMFSPFVSDILPINFAGDVGSNIKILSVGIPSGLVQDSFNEIVNVPQEGESVDEALVGLFSGREKDLIKVNVHMKDLEFDDLVFEPVSFLFEMSRFVNRSKPFFDLEAIRSGDTPKVFAANFGNTVVSHKTNFRNFTIDTGKLSFRDEIGLDILSDDRYAFLSERDRKTMLTNHVVSYLLATYIRTVTGISIFEDTFFINSSIADFVADDESIETFKSLIETHISVVTGVDVSFDELKRNNRDINKLLGKLEGNSFANPFLRQVKDLTLNGVDTQTNIRLSQDLIDFVRMFSVNSILTGGESTRAKITTPKSFERIFHVPIDPDQFVIDEVETRTTDAGNKLLDDENFLSVTYRDSRGGLRITQRPKNRNNVEFNSFYVSIDTATGNFV